MTGRLTLRLLVIAIVAATVIGVLIVKHRSTERDADDAKLIAAPSRPIPRLLDLGSDTCIPCRRMAPILASMRTEFAGRFDVQFIDVRKVPAAAGAHDVTLIPTQIFFDATGSELFRHQGFFSRDDILKTWRRLGYDFGPTDQQPAGVDPPREGREGVEPTAVPGDGPVPPTSAADRARTIIVYYFHRTLRCETCLALEEHAQRAIETAFPNEIASGRLVWKAVNFDEPEHEHFADDFDLIVSSVVLVEQVDGDVQRWVLLEDAEKLLGTGGSFERYLASNARAYLDGEAAPAERTDTD
jgi:thioredoxin 1